MNTHDSHEKIFPADPRITAYAFGELEGDELKLIEAAVAADPALQAAVAELRVFGGELSTALGDEPVEKVDGDLRAPFPTQRRGRLVPFPLHYLATAVAACFAVVVWVRHEDSAPNRPEPVKENDAVMQEATGIAASDPVVAHGVAIPEFADSMVRFDGSLGFGVGMDAKAKIDAPAVDAFAPPPAPVAASVVALDSRDVGQIVSAQVRERRLFDRQSVGAVTVTLPVHENNESNDADARIVRAPSAPQVSGQFIQEQKELAQLVAKGRSQYLAGDQAGAAATFDTVLAMNPQSPEARSFKSRIEKENAAMGELNRSKTRGQLLETVSDSWQRPGFNSSIMSASVPALRAPESEAYAHSGDSAYRSVATEPLSTFSVDVDTASYSNVRRFISGGRLPPCDAVRIEELINYFPYRYATPKGDAPFAANLVVASAPWAPERRLVRIGIKGRELTAATRSAANLVFLIDVSGSMSPANKLPLVKESLRLLVERLRPDDRVAIVTYAGNTSLTLPSTPASRKGEILAALDQLKASGSTNGGMGIHLAYDIAKANFVPNGGINRVILCTDGDFNVGVTDRGALTDLVAEKAKSRVFLSVFGFGMGNLKDATLESLSGKGNGTYGYIDNRREAEKVFVEQVEGTFATIAKDVKIQVEFNPAKVASYRLVGYENRMLAKEDFNNDAVDAGDIGAGHTVTALYEIVPVGAESDGSHRPVVDPLKYQKADAPKPAMTSGSKELLTVKIRYKAPEGDVSAKQEFPLVDRGATFAEADGEFRFAAAVAAWGMVLRDSPHKGSATAEQVIAWAEDGLANDVGGHRAEFIQLVRRSAELGR